MKLDGTPCSHPIPCTGVHAIAWELQRGIDFPQEMRIHSIQTALHAKAHHAGLRCHTRATKGSIQVQFFRKAEDA
jgi:hypothetical protein